MSTDSTHRLVTGKDQDSLETAENSANEILDVVLLTLRDNPLRTDMWMMRFEILRTVGLKPDFASAMSEAYSNSSLRRGLDWDIIRNMWEQLAPGEAAPDGVILPKTRKRVAKDDPKSKKKPIRRFSDIARLIADAELSQLAHEYQVLRAKPGFFTNFAGATRKALFRPTPLHRAQALETDLGSPARIFLKREDKLGNTPEREMAAAQAFIASALNKQFVITGNDVDEFSIALTEIGASFGLKVTVVLSQTEIDKKSEHIAQLRELGAQVEVMRGKEMIGTDPREGALRLWTRMHKTCHLALSFGTGPNPYPRMVSDFQMLLGYECELQLRAQGGAGRARTMVASVQSESDSIGFILPYLKRRDIDLFYAESANTDGRSGWRPSERLRAYNGAKREHSWLRASGLITHVPINDQQAKGMQDKLQQLEKITVSLEDARAVVLAAGLVRGEVGDRDIVVLVG